MARLRTSKGHDIVSRDGGQFLVFKDARNIVDVTINLTQHRGAVGTFNTRKSISQRSRKTFSFLNYVNIGRSQNCPLISNFILLVLLFLGLKHNSHKTSWKLFLIGFLLNTSFWLQSLLVLLSDDIEINPGPTRTLKATLSICHWNLNSISTHNYVKWSLLKAYLVFHKFDIVCLSESG